ncbi:2052_t:CDS:2, partial [Racocetra fulgida]
FAHLDNIRGSYIFTHKVHKEMSFKLQWGKEFVKEMELEILTEDTRDIKDDNIDQFALLISNPISIRSK